MSDQTNDGVPMPPNGNGHDNAPIDEAKPEAAEIKITMTTTADNNVKLNVHGPLHDPMLCEMMMAGAKRVLEDHWNILRAQRIQSELAAQRARIVKPQGIA